MSTNLLAAGIGAFAVSEATGTTNLTAIGTGGSDEEDDSNPLSRIPSFAPPGPNGGPPIDVAGLVEAVAGGGGGGAGGTVQRVIERVQVPTGDLGGDGEGPSLGDLADNLEEGTLYDPDRFDDLGGDDSGDSGSSGGSDSFGITDGIRAVNNFDAGDAGTSVGEGASNFAENAVGEASEGLGATIASIPARAVEGAIDYGSARGNDTRRWLENNTDIKPSDTGINDDRPGVGVTDAVNAGKNVATDSLDDLVNVEGGAGPEIGGIPAVGPAVTDRLPGNDSGDSGSSGGSDSGGFGGITGDSDTSVFDGFGGGSDSSDSSSGSTSSGSSGSSGGSNGLAEQGDGYGGSLDPIGSDDPEDEEEPDDPANASGGGFAGFRL